MHSAKSLIQVFTGCCSSAFLMEILMFKYPQSANFVTFLQFFFISGYGLVTTSKFGSVSRNIPILQYTILVTLFFVTSMANNFVYSLHVPSTLHMIIRSASSPASMLVYCYAKKQRPSLNKALGSVLITVGVALAMYGGAATVHNEGEFLYWCIGVTILLTSLVTGAFTGLQQEILYTKYGKHPNEMLFYTHVLPLPLFVTMYPQLRETALNTSIDVWVLIIPNIVSQFICTRSVHELATRETSVTVTFILTLRKFVSLLISTVVFKNNLTMFHVAGTVLVAVGTYVYFDFFTERKQRSVSFKDK